MEKNENSIFYLLKRLKNRKCPALISCRFTVLFALVPDSPVDVLEDGQVVRGEEEVLGDTVVLCRPQKHLDVVAPGGQAHALKEEESADYWVVQEVGRVARFGLFEAKKQIWPFLKIGWPRNFYNLLSSWPVGLILGL